jgi:hypothetical protein
MDAYHDLIPQAFGSLVGAQVGIGGAPALFTTTGAAFDTLAWAVRACSEANPITARARTRARTTFFIDNPLEEFVRNLWCVLTKPSIVLGWCKSIYCNDISKLNSTWLLR